MAIQSFSVSYYFFARSDCGPLTPPRLSRRQSPASMRLSPPSPAPIAFGGSLHVWVCIVHNIAALPPCRLHPPQLQLKKTGKLVDPNVAAGALLQEAEVEVLVLAHGAQTLKAKAVEPAAVGSRGQAAQGGGRCGGSARPGRRRSRHGRR